MNNGPKTEIKDVERFFSTDEMIVTKTNLKGVLTYANDIFIDISDYTEDDLIGKQHNVIRHPHMPRTIFKLLWSTIESGKEIFAYVKNRCKNGEYYWVLAHVTPSFDDNGKIIGYHSNRRVPNRKTLENIIIPLYKTLLEEEQKQENAKIGITAGMALLEKILKEQNMEYDEFIFANL